METQALSITPKMIGEYLVAHGNQCLYCKSDAIETHTPLECLEDGTARQLVKCAGCHQTWTDYYKLYDVEPRETI